MAGLLQEILEHKRAELAQARQHTGIEEMARRCEGLPPAAGFRSALEQARASSRLGVIAEAKRQSPSAGTLVADYDPGRIARLYESAGAACLSVLTDRRYFGGGLDDLAAARAACPLPVLRKDFVIDPWQVYETRLAGASCLLLIVAALAQKELVELTRLALSLGLDVLVEIHDETEVDAALATGSSLLGVNNRNLSTLRSDIGTSARIIPRLVADDRLIVAESAIATPEDASRVRAAGADAILVGESLLRAKDPGLLLARLSNPAGSGG